MNQDYSFNLLQINIIITDISLEIKTISEVLLNIVNLTTQTSFKNIILIKRIYDLPKYKQVKYPGPTQLITN